MELWIIGYELNWKYFKIILIICYDSYSIPMSTQKTETKDQKRGQLNLMI